MESNQNRSLTDYSLGCRMALNEWLELNSKLIFEDASLTKYVAPFPPQELMYDTGSLDNNKDFALHGAHFFEALTKASPVPLISFKHILDFGCGCGRLARYFKGHPNKVTGCDIDVRMVDWTSNHLQFMNTVLTQVHPPLPFKNKEFDAIISISIFTHLSEESQNEFLAELSRICSPEGHLFLTVHGKTALNLAMSDTKVWNMLDVDKLLFEDAIERFEVGNHAFIKQSGGPLTSRKNKSAPKKKKLWQRVRNKIARIVAISQSSPSPPKPFEYGITFIPENYIRNKWNKWFEIVDYRDGALHNFQDIVVLKPLKK